MGAELRACICDRLTRLNDLFDWDAAFLGCIFWCVLCVLIQQQFKESLVGAIFTGVDRFHPVLPVDLILDKVTVNQSLLHNHPRPA